MRTTKKASKPKFGTPINDLPDALAGVSRPAPYWTEVAEHVRANPGAWHPVRLDHLTIKGHSSAAQRINAASRNSDSKTSKNPAFADPGYQAAYREGVLYVRYDVPVATPIRKRRAS